MKKSMNPFAALTLLLLTAGMAKAGPVAEAEFQSGFKIPQGYEQSVQKAVKNLQKSLFTIETHGSQEAGIKQEGLNQCYNQLKNMSQSELHPLAEAFTGKFDRLRTEEYDYADDWTRNEDGNDCPRFFSVHFYLREVVKLKTVIWECISSCQTLDLVDGATKSSCITVPKVEQAGDAQVEQVQDDDWQRSCFSPGIEPSEDGDSWVKIEE